MQTEKLSISLPATLVQFIERYKAAHGCKTHSQVVAEALQLLCNRELEQAYREASADADSAWESTMADGLNDETWRDLLCRSRSHDRF